MAHRIERVNNLIRRELSALLQRQVKDPRLGSFITVTEVNTSSDLRHAKIFISCLGGKGETQEILSVLDTASGFFRRELSRCLRLRRIPELSFQWDNSIERGAHLQSLIDRISADSTPSQDIDKNCRPV